MSQRIFFGSASMPMRFDIMRGPSSSSIMASSKGGLTFNKAFKVKPPFVLAMIELEEGPRMMSNLIGIEADPKKIRCDMPVEVVFEKLTDEITLPLFRPAGGAR